MLLKSDVPTYMPVLPPSIITSLLIDDHLTPQREKARKILVESLGIYTQYYEKKSHPLVTIAMATRALEHTDHTTLRTTRNETTEYMQRMAYEATHPYLMRSVTTWPDDGTTGYSNKWSPVVDYLRDYPTVGITAVLGYPHGFRSPDEAKRAIDLLRKKNRDVINPIDIDTVINGAAWMQGDHKLVETILKAEGEAARDNGLTWKSIQQVSLHAMASENKTYGADFFRSVYDSTRMALEAGADCAKTSTGVAAKPPYNYFVSQDTGIIFRSLPMLTAIADFNRDNNAQRWPKFSGGNTNEADAAVAYNASRNLLAPEIAENIVFGTSYRFRLRLLTFIALKTWPESPFDVQTILKPHGIDIPQLAAHRMGVPKPLTESLVA